jgi:hypothetical protein
MVGLAADHGAEGDQRVAAPALRYPLQRGRDLALFPGVAERIGVADRLALDQVDDALEPILGADRQLDRNGTRAEPVDNRLHGGVEVGAHPVHLVDEHEPRNGVLVGLAPDGLRLGLNAGHGIEERDRSIEHAQRPLDLDRKVNVAGSVDDVDAMVAPERSRRGRRDRDAALLLLGHPVHRRRALVDLADLVGLARVEQDALGRRGLAGVDVGHDPDVPDQAELVHLRNPGVLLSCDLRHGGCELSAYQR